MGVTLKVAPKAKAKAKPQAALEIVPVESVESLAALDAQMRKAKGAFESLKKAYDQAVSAIVARAETVGQLSAAEALTVQGAKHVLQIGAKANVCEIDTAKAFIVLRAIDSTLPETLAKFGVGDLRDYLTPPQFAEVATETQTGRRTVKIKPK